MGGSDVRYSQTEMARMIRHEQRRDPIDNAVYAMAALGVPDRATAVARFNAIFADPNRKAPPLCKLSIDVTP